MGQKTKNIHEYRLDNPGPDQYDPNVDSYSTKQRVTGVRFGKSKRGYRPHTANPGPGSYEITGGPEAQTMK